MPTADRKKLYELVDYFRNQITTMVGIEFLESHSPIQGIMVGDSFKAKALAEYLFSKGFFIRAILPPTVPLGKERLRVCLHSFNSEEQIDLLLSEIKYFLQ
jgi:8-amino-7-oxononanoate synthase